MWAAMRYGKIHALSKEYGFSIIEDASHAIGVNIKKVILVLTSILILQSLVFIQSKLLQQLKVEWRLPIMKI